MPGKAQRFSKGLGTRSVAKNALILLSTVIMATCEMAAQSPRGIDCFGIKVRLNGKEIGNPHIILLKIGSDRAELHAEGGCFKVPPKFLGSNSVDVTFEVLGNRVYLSSVSASFLKGPWEVDLADRKFKPGTIIPRGAKIKEVCAVVFHVGTPEREMAMHPCRTALVGKRRIIEK
jgi:hypothetical protein